MLARLRQQAEELPPARRIYPRLLSLYLTVFWTGDDATAASQARTLCQNQPGDGDLRLLAAFLLNRQERFADALALLRDVDALRPTETPVNVQEIVLAAAVGAKDLDAARAAAARLGGMRLDPGERQAVAEDLSALGLTAEAGGLTAATSITAAPPPAARRPPGSGLPRTLFDYETAQQIQGAVDRKDEVAALALARSALAALPPPAANPNGGGDNAEFVLQMVRRVLTEFKRRDAFIADAERQLALDPDSLTLNYQLAVLHEDDPGPKRAAGDPPDPEPGGRAAVYWRKLAALRPLEVRYTRLLAHRLAAHGGRDEAAALYDRLIEADPEATFANFEDVRAVYAGRRMAALGERMLAWPSASSGPARTGRSIPGFAYFQVAQRCAELHRPDLVVALCRRALAQDQAVNPGGYDNPEVYQLLLKTLVDTRRRDEARDALVALYAPPETDAKSASAVPPTELGFRNPAYRPRQARPWLNSISWNLDGVDLYGLAPLETAREAGLLPDLRDALAARRAADPQGFTGQSLDWLLTLLRVDTRDPAVAGELPALLNAPPADRSRAGGTVGTPQQETAVRLALARRLARWPGHEDLALEAYRSARRTLAADRNSRVYSSGSLAGIASLQEAGAALQLDDPRSALATLHDFAGQLLQSTNTRSVGGNLAEIKRCLALLARCGPEADALYVELSDQAERESQKAMPGFSARALGSRLGKSLRVGGASRDQAFAWLLGGDGPDPGPDATLVWEVCPARPGDPGGECLSPAAHGRSFPGSERERALTFHYGPDAAHTVPIGQLKTSQTFGTWTGPVPPGSGVLKVTLDTSHPLDTDPAAPAEPPPDGWLRAVRAPNLLANPSFDGLENRPETATFDLAGWRGLPAGFWRLGHGENPLPGRPYVQSAADGGTEPRTIYGARIPIEPGRAYFQSGWVRDSREDGSIVWGRRYLTAEGRVLKAGECPGASTQTWHWQAQRLLPAAASDPDSDAIPADAAFIEPYLRVQGAEDWTGLFLGQMK